MNTPNQSNPQIRPLELTRKSLIKALEYDDLTVPVLPKIAQDVLAMSQDPNADMEALSDLIHQDQAIASHVLHISNSAAFGTADRIESLEMALTRLGMKLLGEIAISVSIQKNVFNIPKFKTEIREMWRQSLASAILANELAAYARISQDTLYMCGLLHEIGKPVTLFTINNLSDEITSGLEKSHIMSLVEEFHMSVGTIVTRQWELPDTIQITNLYYKDWNNSPDCKTEAAITYLADRLAKKILHPTDNDIESILADKAFEFVGVTTAKLDRLLEFKDTVAEKVSSMDF